LAISKQRKEQLVAQYTDWLNKSQAMFLVEYTGLNMKQMDDLRSKVREVGGEFHIVKNTLGKVAFEKSNLQLPEKFLQGSSAIVFAFQDPPAMAKVLSDFVRGVELVKVKGGYLGKSPITAQGVRDLAQLPPLPVVRAQLLGTILAPASKLARTLAEPARQLASVLKSYAEKDAASAAA
jgi:large subunit ribosomal protein L10